MSLEEASEKLHDRADVQVFVDRCFVTHQVGHESEETPGFWMQTLAHGVIVPSKLLGLTAIDHRKVVCFGWNLCLELPVKIHALAYVLVNHTVSEILNGGR